MKRLRKLLAICVLALAITFSSEPTLEIISSPIQVEAATAVKLNKTKLIINKGKTYQLKLSGTKKKATWKSSKKSVATVSSKGKVTAKKAGTTVITAKLGKKSYRCNVTVENPQINKKTATVYVNKTVTLQIKNTVRKVTWKTKNKKIATVNSNGVVTGKKAGSTTITAKVGSKTFTCKVTVKKKASAADQQKEAVLKLINQARKKAGLSAVKMDNSALSKAADVRAKEIAESFSHTRPNGESCFSILNEKNYKVLYWAAGENIAAGYADADSVMTGWMNSSGHKANILSSYFDTVGIGYYYNASKPFQYYWVQIFVQKASY